MISKELLSDVLKFKVTNILHIGKNQIAVYDGTVLADSITEWNQVLNVYELESMLKEWAIKQRYGGDFFVLEIISGHLKGNSYALVEYRIYSEYIKNGEEDFKKAITTGTELENVIEICEWILKQKDNYVK